MKPLHPLLVVLALASQISPGPALANSESSETSLVLRSSSYVSFEAPSRSGGALLTMTGPEGWALQKVLAAGTGFQLEVSPELADGLYRYELRLIPKIDEEARQALQAAREAGETAPELRAAGILPPEPQVIAGTFTLAEGALVKNRLSEQESSSRPAPYITPASGAGPESDLASWAKSSSPDLANLSAADVVFLDDVIADGSLCVGSSCVNGESFGQDSIRIKEVNTRIKFLDTSSSTFPSNDWQLTANDSNSGGADKFSIDDVTAGETPLTIEAGAGDHALYVDDAGRVGFGTNTPTTEAHFVDGDTAVLRLQQDASSSFTPQTWDLGGNETNFFLRDVTHGSKLPFRIKPDAPADSLHIAVDGNVGMGTAAPQAGIHVVRGGSEAVRDLLQLTNNGRVRWRLQDTSPDGQTLTVRLAEGDLDFSFSGTTGDQVEMKSNGNMVIQGTLTQMSDRDRKTDITPIEPAEILEQVNRLPISHWRMLGDDPKVRHLGPMAQDFYALFGLGGDERHIATLDTSGVALAAIQALSQQLTERDERLRELEARNSELLERLEALEARQSP